MSVGALAARGGASPGTFRLMERDTYRRIVARLIADESGYAERRAGVDWPWAQAICVDRPRSAPIKNWLAAHEHPARCFVNDAGRAGFDFFEFPDDAALTLFALAWR